VKHTCLQGSFRICSPPSRSRNSNISPKIADTGNYLSYLDIL
jgi:hypothetical protein